MNPEPAASPLDNANLEQDPPDLNREARQRGEPYGHGSIEFRVTCEGEQRLSSSVPLPPARRSRAFPRRITSGGSYGGRSSPPSVTSRGFASSRNKKSPRAGTI